MQLAGHGVVFGLYLQDMYLRCPKMIPNFSPSNKGACHSISFFALDKILKVRTLGMIQKRINDLRSSRL